MENQATQIERLQELSKFSLMLAGDPIDIFKRIAAMIGQLLDVRVVCLSQILGDELHRGVGIGDGRLVVEEQHQSADELDPEEEEGQPTEVVGPAHLVDRDFLLLHHRLQVELRERETRGQEVDRGVVDARGRHDAASSC